MRIKDILKTLDPGAKSDQALIERIRGEGDSLKWDLEIIAK